MRRLLPILTIGIALLILCGCASKPTPFADPLVLQTFDAKVKVGIDRLSEVQGVGFDASLKSQSQSIASAYSDHAKSLRDQLSYLFNAADQDFKQARTEQERTSIRASRDRLVELANTQVGRAQAINLLAIAYEKNPTDTSFKELRNAVGELAQVNLKEQLSRPNLKDTPPNETPSSFNTVAGSTKGYPSGEGNGFRFQVTECTWQGSDIVIKLDITRTGKADKLRISGKSSVAIDDHGRPIPVASASIDGGTSGDNASRSNILLNTVVSAQMRFKPGSRDAASLREVKVRTTVGEIIISDVPIR